jgi:hypothetical protein
VRSSSPLACALALGRWRKEKLTVRGVFCSGLAPEIAFFHPKGHLSERDWYVKQKTYVQVPFLPSFFLNLAILSHY